MVTAPCIPSQQLRQWAAGAPAAAAAVGLLTTALGGSLATVDRPWIVRGPTGGWALDATVVDDTLLAGLDPVARRVLLVAVSLACHHPVVLSEVLVGLDPATFTAVCTAVACAAGYTPAVAAR